MPNRKLQFVNPVPLVVGISFLAAAAIGARLFGVPGALFGLTLACLVQIALFASWSRRAVAPTNRTDLETARRQLQVIRQPRRAGQAARWRAANILRSVGPDCAPLVPVLIELLDHPDFIIKAHLCEALGKIGPAAKESLPALMELLKEDPFPATFALGGIGPDAKVAVPLLREHLQAGTGNCQTFVAIALWKIEQNAELIVPALLEILNDDRAPHRRAAVHALSQIGPPAQAAIPALVQALRDQDRWVRRSAAQALGKINPIVSRGEVLF
jgi:HEAT repeat protein